jgi:uncharacterized protein
VRQIDSEAWEWNWRAVARICALGLSFLGCVVACARWLIKDLQEPAASNVQLFGGFVAVVFGSLVLILSYLKEKRLKAIPYHWYLPTLFSVAFALIIIFPEQISRAYKGANTKGNDSNLRTIALGLKDYEVVKKELQLKPENPLTYFEIPVTDLERAIRFYETVFDCKLERSTIDGNEMAVFPGTPSAPGCIGALAMGPTYKPSMDGARVYFHTDDIDKTLQIVVNSGGKIEYPKTSIGELGSVAEFIDTEGNRIALHSPKKE